MHVLYFSRDYSTHDNRFLSALAETEDRISYLRLECRPQPFEQRPLPSQVEIVHWRGAGSQAQFRDGFSLLFDLKRIIRSLKPDLILAGPIQRTALLVALTGYKPLVTMSWGYDLLQEADKNKAWDWATRYTLKHSAAMVGDCETVRRMAIAYGMPADRIVTFPWGIDLDHFSPSSSQNRTNQIAEAPFTLVSTRNWEPIYGVETIARAFAAAASQRPELRLILLGNGSQASVIHRLLSGISPVSPDPRMGSSAPANRVIFPGLVSFDELPRCYRSANLYVSATHSDGSSISLLEAMGCGLPVLVSDIPGNREWVTHEINGWLFPDGDADALTKGILRALEERDRLPEMGKRSRQIAEQRADWKQNFPCLQHAFELARNHTH